MARPVLLIDDVAAYRKSVAALFRGSGYQIVEAESPKDGINQLDRDPELQVIILDLSFEGDSGTTVLEHIARRSHDYRVIVLTGHDELLAAEQAGKYEVFNYLPKAQESSAQSILFSVARAFDHLDQAHLTRKTNALLSAQKKITQNDPIECILDFICECVCKIAKTYTCHIRVYDFKRGDFHVNGFAGGPDPRLRMLFGQPKAGNDEFSGEVVRSRQSAAHQDLQRHADFLKFKADALGRSWAPPELSDAVRTYFDRAASAYIVPIFTGLFGNHVDAVLNVSSDQPEYFTPEKQSLVNEFANQAALAISKDWLQKKRLEAHKDYGAISEMLAAISQATREPEPLKAVYRVVTQGIANIVSPEIVTVFRYDESTGIVKNVAEYRMGQTIDDSEEEYSSGVSLTGHVVSEDATIHLPPPDEPDPQSPTEHEWFDKDNETRYLEMIPSGELKHYLGVPIRVGGRIRGVIRALNKKSQYYDEGPPIENRRCLLERGFSQDCRNALEIAANHLAAAIHNVELLEEKDRRVDQVQALGEVGRLINSEMDIKDVLRVTIQKMRELMQAEICMLFLKDKETRRVVLEQVFGMDEDRIPEAVRDVAELVRAEVEQSGQPFLISDERYRDGGISSLMAVPIQARDHLVGVMTVINKDGDQLTYEKKEVELFKTFADYVGVAIENAQIYKLTNDRLAIAERSAVLSLLVSAVAHEINNTSGVIPMTIETFREYLGAAIDENIDGMLTDIEDAANQASDFANELAGFSAKKVGVQKALDVNKVIAKAVNLLDKQFRKSNAIDVHWELATAPLVCEIFSNPFKQIVRNIVINSIQALEGTEGGLIRISSTRVSNGKRLAEIRFEDNGPGIPPEYYDAIFEPEFSLKENGNGIGLWLARIQLEAVGGTIEVDRETRRGAAFFVRIPLSENPESIDEDSDPDPDRR